MSLELVSGIVVGLAIAGLGATIGFAPPGEEEAAADPRTLRWGRRPAVRRRLGLVLVALGLLLVALRIGLATAS